jgi:hypothetical protein
MCVSAADDVAWTAGADLHPLGAVRRHHLTISDRRRISRLWAMALSVSLAGGPGPAWVNYGVRPGSVRVVRVVSWRVVAADVGGTIV